MMTFGDVVAMACWCEGGGVVYSGPRLAGAVFSWGREKVELPPPGDSATLNLPLHNNNNRMFINRPRPRLTMSTKHHNQNK